MSGLEVLGGVAAVAQIVTQAVGILREISNAVDRLKRHAQCLAMVADEVTRAITLVSMIESMPALNIDPVLGGVQEVYNHAKTLHELVQHLGEVGNQSVVKQFTYHLIKQPKEQVALDKLVDSLKEARTSLLAYIQVAHVGITIQSDVNSAARDGVFINVVVVDEVNKMFHNCPRLESGLQVASLLSKLRQRGIVKDHDQEVFIDKNYLSELKQQESSNEGTSFIAKDLIAELNAVHLAAPIGDGSANRDAFDHYQHIEIARATAKEGSLLVASPNSRNTLDALKNHQLRLAAINKGQQMPTELWFNDP